MNAAQKLLLAGLCGLLLNLPADAQEKAPAPKAAPAAGPVQIVLTGGDASAKPTRTGCVGFAHTGGGDIQVAQPAPHVLVITMMGTALAKGQIAKESSARWTFDMSQCFEIVAQPSVKDIKLSIEGRLIGLLQSGTGCCGPHATATADVSNAHASIACGDTTIVGIDMPERSASCGHNEMIQLREGPCSQVIQPGCFTLHQTLDLGATVKKCPMLCKAVQADFAPSHALDPAWLGVFDPFHGTIDKDFGFRVTIRAVPAN
ncbi:MAG: hypothetical protein JNM56_25235 [Planctomycetia bacterium]|nr:hypothetical protein [Planctomycetia bacterium]